MKSHELRDRITLWAVAVDALATPLFSRIETRNRANQLQRSADSAASNYRAACIARSHNEFLSKLCIALEEADEAVGWLEMSKRRGTLTGPALERALDEGRQLTRILAKSRMTAEDTAGRRHGLRGSASARNDQ